MSHPPVTIDAMAAAMLLDFALGQLHGDNQLDGCCPRCCGPCAAIQKLHDDGQLDDVWRPYAQESEQDWWDPENGTARWDAIQGAWRLTDCHAPEDEPQ
jgi:hypothetical protein